jgi:hypothetical protein
VAQSNRWASRSIATRSPRDRDLCAPKGTTWRRVSDKQLGISLRIVRDYDITTDQFLPH